MLKHADNLQTHSQSAAKVRVTPEELAAAVTALQIRKEGQPGTIAIGDAVEELGLDVTPEEVLAEVQAGRIKQRHLRKRPSKRSQRFVLALGLIGVVLGLAIDGNAFLHRHDGSGVAQVNRNPPAVPLTAAPNLTVCDSSGKILMLSEVGDDQPVHCTFDSLSNTFSPYLPYGPSWTLIKHHGRLYVRGWMMRASAVSIKYYGVDVRETSDSAVSVPVTFPVDSLQVTPQSGNDERLQSRTVEIDRHAYEKW